MVVVDVDVHRCRRRLLGDQQWRTFNLFREDWINVETLAENLPDVPLVVVNGALDKVRDGGYYPAVFFPAWSYTLTFSLLFRVIFAGHFSHVTF